MRARRIFPRNGSCGSSFSKMLCSGELPVEDVRAMDGDWLFHGDIQELRSEEHDAFLVVLLAILLLRRRYLEVSLLNIPGMMVSRVRNNISLVASMTLSEEAQIASADPLGGW
jgi:hypothetical protein